MFSILDDIWMQLKIGYELHIYGVKSYQCICLSLLNTSPLKAYCCKKNINPDPSHASPLPFPRSSPELAECVAGTLSRWQIACTPLREMIPASTLQHVHPKRWRDFILDVSVSTPTHSNRNKNKWCNICNIQHINNSEKAHCLWTYEFRLSSTKIDFSTHMQERCCKSSNSGHGTPKANPTHANKLRGAMTPEIYIPWLSCLQSATWCGRTLLGSLGSVLVFMMLVSWFCFF